MKIKIISIIPYRNPHDVTEHGFLVEFEAHDPGCPIERTSVISSGTSEHQVLQSIKEHMYSENMKNQLYLIGREFEI